MFFFLSFFLFFFNIRESGFIEILFLASISFLAISRKMQSRNSSYLSDTLLVTYETIKFLVFLQPRPQ